MPKEIKSAAEVLGEVAAEGEATPSPVSGTLPPEKPENTEPPAPPEPGFEAPPAEVQDAPTAAQVLSGSGSLDQSAPPPPTAAPTQAKEAVIPARPESIAPTETEEISPEPVKVAAQRKSWHFVKNVHFGEKVFLKDGTQLKYSSPSFVITDAALAAKILEVAKIYNIVQK